MHNTEFKQQLQLYLSGELDVQERQTIQRHLEECGECRIELEHLQKLGTLVLQRPELEVDDRLLQEARQELHAALRNEKSRRRFWAAVDKLFPSLTSKRFAFALGGGVIFVVGIAVGRFYLPANRPHNAPLGEQVQTIQGATLQAQGEPHITNVRFITTGGDAGEVEFMFDAVTPARMKGSVNDPRIQKVLAHAIVNNANPGVRLQAIAAMGGPTPITSDREIKAALILSLKSDLNTGVRMQALSVLQRYALDGDIKNAMLHTLMYDKNPGLRIAAINALDSAMSRDGSIDRTFLDVLRETERSDDNNYIRLRAQAVLQEVKQP
jgi:hypothetical protein